MLPCHFGSDLRGKGSLYRRSTSASVAGTRHASNRACCALPPKAKCKPVNTSVCRSQTFPVIYLAPSAAQSLSFGSLVFFFKLSFLATQPLLVCWWMRTAFQSTAGAGRLPQMAFFFNGTSALNRLHGDVPWSFQRRPGQQSRGLCGLHVRYAVCVHVQMRNDLLKPLHISNNPIISS